MGGVEDGMHTAEAVAPVCARCKQGGGVIACMWCGGLFHNGRGALVSLDCLVAHVKEEHGKG